MMIAATIQTTCRLRHLERRKKDVKNTWKWTSINTINTKAIREELHIVARHDVEQAWTRSIRRHSSCCSSLGRATGARTVVPKVVPHIQRQVRAATS
mmetsp:Transcript_105736/g.294373  ORF Transcript_105736/g.294373 Transcript_105736/m.294373 type:complete len:97 (+) Transcript_105736:178-468(+)